MKKSKIFTIGIVCIIIIVATILLIFLNKDKKMEKAQMEEKNGTVVASAGNKQIYGSFKTNASWVKDPSEVENLLQMADNASIVKVKVKEIGEANFLQPTAPTPYTPVKVKIEEIIKGNDTVGDKTIYIEGGDVKVTNVIKTLNDVEIEKMGMNTLTQEEKNNMYISYTLDYDYDLEIDREYIVVLTNDNISKIMGCGYGVFEEEQTNTRSNTRTIKNVLTGKTFNY